MPKRSIIRKCRTLIFMYDLLRTACSFIPTTLTTLSLEQRGTIPVQRWCLVRPSEQLPSPFQIGRQRKKSKSADRQRLMLIRLRYSILIAHTSSNVSSKYAVSCSCCFVCTISSHQQSRPTFSVSQTGMVLTVGSCI